MTNEELKEAFLNNENVMYNGVEYELLEIVYAHSTDKRIKKPIVACWLLPLNGANSMTRVIAKDVERLGEHG